VFSVGDIRNHGTHRKANATLLTRRALTLPQTLLTMINDAMPEREPVLLPARELDTFHKVRDAGS
jgi:hypothetical protein